MQADEDVGRIGTGVPAVICEPKPQPFARAAYPPGLLARTTARRHASGPVPALHIGSFSQVPRTLSRRARRQGGGGRDQGGGQDIERGAHVRPAPRLPPRYLRSARVSLVLL